MYSKEINFGNSKTVQFDFVCKRCSSTVSGTVPRPIYNRPTDTTVSCCGKFFDVDVISYAGGVNGVFYVQELDEKAVVNIKMV
ncbi:hypothetical protein FACS189485_21220 [Spirochaetia bacterium]|nr:hypothetical protein FACS189479_02660 [Spirochaetia bacterium]GHV09043.1 hypothetical protein FACS189485_21220 [Spirochaetia bacterium]